jgi:serine/threonine protein kinase
MLNTNIFACIDCVSQIGDYGTATTTHLEDYVPVNGDNCPVRWISPEILRILDGGEGEVVWTKEANIWSLAVTLWEVMTFGERPFDQLSDFRFVDSALKETDELVGKIGKFRARVRGCVDFSCQGKDI